MSESKDLSKEPSVSPQVSASGLIDRASDYLWSATDDGVTGILTGKYSVQSQLTSIALKAISQAAGPNSLVDYVAKSIDYQVSAVSKAALPIIILTAASPVLGDEVPVLAITGAATLTAATWGTVLGIYNYFSDLDASLINVETNSPKIYSQSSTLIDAYNRQVGLPNGSDGTQSQPIGPEFYVEPDLYEQILLTGQLPLWSTPTPQDGLPQTTPENTGPEAFTEPDDYQNAILLGTEDGPELYLLIDGEHGAVVLPVSTLDDMLANGGDATSGLNDITPVEMMTADASGLVVPTLPTDTGQQTGGQPEALPGISASDLANKYNDGNQNYESEINSSADAITDIALEDLSKTYNELSNPYLATNQSIYHGVTAGYGLYKSIETGDALSIAQNTLSLVQNVDKFIDTATGDVGSVLPADMGGFLKGVGAGTPAYRLAE